MNGSESLIKTLVNHGIEVCFANPGTPDIEGIAGPVSHWVHTSTSPEAIARDAAEAVRQAGQDRVAMPHFNRR